MEFRNPFDDWIDIEIKSFSDLLRCSPKIENSPRRNLYLIPLQYLLNGIHIGDISYNYHNRVPDKERTFEEPFDIEMMDPIILAEHERIYYILDGQHRIEYFKKNAKQADWDKPIFVDIRNYQNDDEFVRQLRIINSRRIMEEQEADPNIRKYKDFEELFLSNIHFQVEFKKNRPYVNRETLRNAIVATDLFRSRTTSGRDIFEKIVLINRFISRLDPSKWSSEPHIEHNYIQKAKFNTHYYLAIDKDYRSIRYLMDVDPSTFEVKWNEFLERCHSKRMSYR